MKQVYKVIVLSLVVVFLLAGCQSQPTLQEDGSAGREVLPTPYSEGPTSGPAVKGPTSPPPGSAVDTNENPQAITEVEDVKYTLPESN